MDHEPQSAGLSEADYGTINRRLTELARLSTEIQQAALAGCAVGERGAMCQKLIDQFKALKAAYFGNRP